MKARYAGISLVATVLIAACSDATSPVATANGKADGPLMDVIQSTDCQPTGLGSLTANYINTVPSDPFDVTCDIGIFFDQPGIIDGAHVRGTLAGAKSTQYGIRIAGANVNIVNSTVEVVSDYPHQFVSIGYRDAASGTVENNLVTGGHRAGILVVGAGTSATVKNNTVRGEGPTNTGWANNGIQVSDGAAATVAHNLVEDHWWNLDNWVSSGILIYGDGISAHSNTVRNNDAGIYVYGSGNNTVGNIVEVTYEEADIAGVYGVIVWGDNNGVRQSTIRSEGAGYIGLYVGGNSNKLIRNTVTGWTYNLYDEGTGTKVPQPFVIED